jgi:hypothetical protein
VNCTSITLSDYRKWKKEGKGVRKLTCSMAPHDQAQDRRKRGEIVGRLWNAEDEMGCFVLAPALDAPGPPLCALDPCVYLLPAGVREVT